MTNQVYFKKNKKQLRFNPPTLKKQRLEEVNKHVVRKHDAIEPAEGTGTKDILRNYLEDYNATEYKR